MIYDELIKHPIEELRVLAAQHNIKTHPRQKVETIAKALIEHLTAKPVKAQPKVEAPKALLVVHTEEQVRELLAALLAKDSFTADFPGDNTVTFKCRGAEECIHLSSTANRIKSRATIVARGALRMFTKKNTDGADVMMVGM